MYLLVALLLKSIIALRSLGASQLSVFLLEDWLHNKVVNLGQIQNEMNKKSRSCTFTFSQLCIFLLGSTHNINLYPSHLVQLADEKHSLLISVHLVESL